MKLAYVVQWDVTRSSGVLKKIVSQCRCWQANGCDVRLFAVSPGREVWSGLDGLPVSVVRQRSMLSRFADVANLVKQVRQWGPQLAYLRFGVYYPAWEAMAKRIPTVIEINSYDVTEHRHTLSLFEYLYHMIFRSRLLKRAAGMVCVSNELQRWFEKHHVPSVAIGNGADFDGLEPLPPCRNDVPNLTFLGSKGCKWHGLEKLLELAALRPNWQFHVIGIDSHEGSPPNVRFYGHLDRDRYIGILARTDVAVGALALYVNNMDEASPLKVREYLAMGLPVIAAYTDTDFPSPVPFFLRLRNAPGSMASALAEIDAFVDRWRGRRVSRRDVEHLDWRVKEARRLEFFSRLLAGRG